MFSCTNSHKFINFLNSTIKISINQPRSNSLNVFHSIQIAGYKTKTIESKLGLPEKPKKPLTAFFRFLKDMRPKVMAKDQKISTTEVVKVVSNMWSTFDEEMKKKLQEEYKKEQLTYLIRRAEYDKSLTQEQKLELKEFKEELAENRKRLAKKQKMRELGRPKKPASPFLMYLQDERKTNAQKQNETYRDWQTRIAEKWNKLNKEQKGKYFGETKINSEKYRESLKKWEQNMSKLGHVELIRNETASSTSNSNELKRKPKIKP